MGINRGIDVDYHCSSDCKQGGCPGHKLRLDFNRSADIYIVVVDGTPTEYFDENRFIALLKADELAHPSKIQTGKTA